MLRLARRVAKLLSEAEDCHEEGILDLLEMWEKLGLDRTVLSGGRGPASVWRNSSRNRKLKAEAKKGASLAFDCDDRNGRVRARVDGAAAIGLPPKLCELLIVLSSSTLGQGGDDGLTPWKTKAQIVSALEKRSLSVKEENVANLVFRLRERFKSQGLNPFLIQTQGPTYRFALRPSGEPG
ncbi:MAG: hypothetical protein ACE5JX_06850 [Acidobacteriota bacterium]